MRLPALLLATLVPLAGCTQLDPGDDDPDFTGTCPSWVKGMGTQVIEGALLLTKETTAPDFDRWDFREATAEAPGNGLGDGYLEFNGHPLDQIVLDFHQRDEPGKPKRLLWVLDAELHLRFYRADGGQVGEPVEAWDQALGASSSKHEWVFGKQPGKEFGYHNITLRIDLTDPADDPDPHGVFAHWEMIPDLDSNPDTPSAAVMRYAPDLWYRTCGA